MRAGGVLPRVLTLRGRFSGRVFTLLVMNSVATRNSTQPASILSIANQLQIGGTKRHPTGTNTARILEPPTQRLMEQINSNPTFNNARLFQQSQTASNPIENHRSANVSKSEAPNNGPDSGDYSTMFDDDALLKLQSNLEAIAQMAEKSLKQIDR